MIVDGHAPHSASVNQPTEHLRWPYLALVDSAPANGHLAEDLVFVVEPQGNELLLGKVGQSCLAALRHRVLLNFEAQAEGVSNDDVLNEIIKEVGTTAEAVKK